MIAHYICTGVYIYRYIGRKYQVVEYIARKRITEVSRFEFDLEYLYGIF